PERHGLPVKRRLDARIVHFERKPEARHGEPVLDQAHDPEVEAWIAPAAPRQDNVLLNSANAITEQAAVDDRVVVADLSVGPPQRGREVGQPEVLVPGARRPGGGQLELTTIDEDAICDHTERDLIVRTEQTGAGQVGATGIRGRADAVVEEAADMIARTK